MFGQFNKITICDTEVYRIVSFKHAVSRSIQLIKYIDVTQMCVIYRAIYVFNLNEGCVLINYTRLRLYGI